MNQNFDFRKLASEFTVFPDWAYGLSYRAFDLVGYIFYIARQRTHDIAENGGKFTISLKAVAENLGLPSVEEVKNRRYRQLIRTPIEAAIEEIEACVCDNPNAKGRFFITPRVNYETNSIDEWLSGWLEIELRDEYAKSFEAIAEKQKKLIAEARKAEERKRERGEA